MSKFSTILSLDTAMAGIGVGLYQADGDLVVADHRDSFRGQAEFVVPMVKELLAAQGVAFAGVDTIVTPVGPGTFTGLRIGLSAAKGFALALGVPLFGISTLQALAMQYAAAHEGDAREIVVLVETRRSDFYGQIFSSDFSALSDAVCLEAEDMSALIAGRECILIGDAAERFVQVSGCALDIDTGYGRIDAGFLAKALRERPDVFSDRVEPLYLHGAGVSMPKKKPRVLAS